MKLRDIKFGDVFNGSSEWDFLSQSLPFHLRWRRRPDYTGSTLITPPITWSAARSNEKGTLEEQQARGVVIKLRKGAVLKARKLHELVASQFFLDFTWQTHQEPFLVSFMLMGTTPSGRLQEIGNFVDSLIAQQSSHRRFAAPFGLLLRFYCHDIDHDHERPTVQEIGSILSEAERVGVPVVLMLNAMISPGDVITISDHSTLDAICVSDNSPWGFGDINWAGIFGKFHTSPLYKRDFKEEKGEFSGWPLLPIVCDWIKEVRQRGFGKPIIGCGGVHSREDALDLYVAGADAVALDTAGILAPRQVADIIDWVNEYFPALEERAACCYPSVPRAISRAASSDQR